MLFEPKTYMGPEQTSCAIIESTLCECVCVCVVAAASCSCNGGRKWLGWAVEGKRKIEKRWKNEAVSGILKCIPLTEKLI